MCTQCHHVKLLEALRSASPRFALPAREEGVLSPRCDTRLFRIQLYYQLVAAWQIDRKLRRICVRRACVSPEERLLSLSARASCTCVYVHVSRRGSPRTVYTISLSFSLSLFAHLFVSLSSRRISRVYTKWYTVHYYVIRSLKSVRETYSDSVVCD